MNRLTYFTLGSADDAEGQRLDDASSVAYCSMRLLQAYRNDRAELPTSREDEGRNRERSEAWLDWFANRHGGIRALERFEEDLVASQGWVPLLRKGWIDRNVMTVASIKRVRSFVWQQYAERCMWSTDTRTHGEAQVDAIQSAWSSLGYLMAKYRLRSSDGKAEPVIEAMRMKIEQIKHAELAFLTWLHEACRKGAGA